MLRTYSMVIGCAWVSRRKSDTRTQGQPLPNARFGKVLNLTLASNSPNERRDQESGQNPEPDYHQVAVFGGLAETMDKVIPWTKKPNGTPQSVLLHYRGHLSKSTDSSTGYTHTTLVIDEFGFAETKGMTDARHENQMDADQPYNQQQARPPVQRVANGGVVQGTFDNFEDDIPF